MGGPLLGATLYSIGGFQLPFYVTGGCLAVLSLLTYFVTPSKENFEPDKRWSPHAGIPQIYELKYSDCLSNTVSYTTS